jgi:hypothetical protein
MADSADQVEKKELAHYSASVTAWFNTRLEHDKSLLTLSTAGIGVLVTLGSRITLISWITLLSYALALASFIFCLAAVLWIYKRNSRYLEQMIQANSASDPVLDILDRAAIISFGLGILCSSIFGLALATNSFQFQEPEMSNDKQGKHLTGDSFNKALNTRPSPTDLLQKSFNEAGKLKPQGSSAAESAGSATSPVNQQPAPAPAAPASSSQKTKPYLNPSRNS